MKFISDNKDSSFSFKKASILLAFLVIFVYLITYVSCGVYPFGYETFMKSDMFAQYQEFLTFYVSCIKSGNIGELIFSFNRGLGEGGILFYYYYLSSPLNLLLILFGEDNILYGIMFLIILKSILSSISMLYFFNSTHKKINLSTIIFSLMYSFSSFAFLYNINIMWMDAIILLPILTVLVTDVVYKKKYKLYIFTLLLMFISNFYMSYIIGIFLLLYSIGLVVVNDNLNIIEKIKGFLRFVGVSLVSVLMYMIVAIPLLYELLNAHSETEKLGIFSGLSIEQIISKLFIGSFDFIHHNTGVISPYIYAGLFSLIFAIYYLLKNKSDKDKKIYIYILIFYFIAFFLNPLDIALHAFNIPVGFKHRYSYIVSFIILIMAYKGYCTLKNEFDIKLVLFIIFLLLLTINAVTISNALNTGTISYFTYLINTVFLIVYGLLFVFYSKHKNDKKNLIILISISVVLFEIIVNSIALQKGTEGVYIGNYSNKVIVETKDVINEVKSKDKSFYRISVSGLDGPYIKRNANNSYSFGYNGFSHFSSSINMNLSKEIKALGWDSTVDFCYGLTSGTLIDSIFAGKYIISHNNYDIYQKTHKYKNSINNVDSYLYLNPYSLGLGYMVSKDILDIELDYSPSSIFSNQEKVLNLFQGKHENKKYYDINNISSIKTSNLNYYVNSKGEYIISNIDKDKDSSISFSYKLEKASYLKLFNEKLKFKPEIYINGINSDSDSLNPLICLDGEDIVVEIKFDKCDINNINMGDMLPRYINENSFKEAIGFMLEKPSLINIKQGFNSIKASIDVKDGDDILFTSIPFSKSWKLYVDGKEQEIIPLLNTFVGVDLDEGLHEIKLVYKVNGIELGMLLSVVGTIIYFVIIKKEYS